MRIGHMEPMRLDIVQALILIDPRDRLTTPAHLDRLERRPRRKLRRQIRSARIRGTPEHPPRTPANMNHHPASIPNPSPAPHNLTFTMSVTPEQSFTFRPIGHVVSPHHSTADIPKGLGAQHEAEGILRILPQFAPGLADIEGFSHLYVLWAFDRVDGFDLTAQPPSDDRPHGVFSTRSPRRPNPIGLTTVRLLRRDGADLHAHGVDMLDGTPILDIKPYLTSIPTEDLRRGWLAEAESRRG